jgi:hypothetical protein
MKRLNSTQKGICSLSFNQQDERLNLIVKAIDKSCIGKARTFINTGYLFPSKHPFCL